MLPAGAGSLRPAYMDAAEELRHNPGQWQAYESRGSCVILAGPGSGKTKTITIKMARLLAEEIRAPRGIACITFNSECARELKRRLDRLGVDEGQNVFVGTVHSFCLKHVLSPFARLAGVRLPTPIVVASPSEQDACFQQALGRLGIDDTRSRWWRTRFDCYRRTFVDRDRHEWRVHDEQIAQLIEVYETLLHNKGLIDFDDMVLIGLRVIERNRWVQKAIRSRFPVLVVDEYQDLGIPLHRIVLSLCFRGGIRLLAVGDPDQSIYGFTGAKPELLRELAGMEGVESIRLRFNYRCGKTIIDASQAALGEDRDYEAKVEHAGTIDFYECPGGLEEQAQRICHSILPEALRRRANRTLGDMAVLYLDKNDGDVIAEKVSASGMKFIRIDQGAPYKKTPLIRWLEDCARWCSGGWRRGEPRLSNLIRTWIGFNGEIRTDEEVHSCKSLLVSFLFSHRTPDAPLREWLTDFRALCIQKAFDASPDLRDEEEAFARLAEVCTQGGKLADFTLATFSGQGGSPDHLNLITLHSAKGLEFDVVVMMGMDQGRIPWLNSGEGELLERRRLFYVGLTRARHEVHMTYSGWFEKWGKRQYHGPSQFLLEVSNKLCEQDKERDA